MAITGRTPEVDVELRVVRGSDWALAEDPAGCPAPYPGSPHTSGTLIHHVYHCHQFQQVAGRSIASFDRICEFGPGYGSVARLAFRHGFKGRYYGYDLPEFQALQRYYLRSVAETRGASDWQYETPNRLPDGDVSSLFLAFWSLSETPAEDREQWVESISSYSHVFLAYQFNFEGVDNRKWFARLAERLPDHQWETWKIPHSPDCYMLGIRPV